MSKVDKVIEYICIVTFTLLIATIVFTFMGVRAVQVAFSDKLIEMESNITKNVNLEISKSSTQILDRMNKYEYWSKFVTGD